MTVEVRLRSAETMRGSPSGAWIARKSQSITGNQAGVSRRLKRYGEISKESNPFPLANASRGYMIQEI